MTEQELTSTAHGSLFSSAQDHAEASRHFLEHVDLGIKRYGTRAAFAAAVGCTAQAVLGWQDGRLPRSKLRAQVAEALGLSDVSLLFQEPSLELTRECFAESVRLDRAENDRLYSIAQPEDTDAKASAENEASHENANRPLQSDASMAADHTADSSFAHAVPDADWKGELAYADPGVVPVTARRDWEADPDQLPPADRIETVLGERLYMHLASQRLTPRQFAVNVMPNGDRDAFRLLFIIAGTLYPKQKELRAFAAVLGVSSTELRIESKLPSSNMRSVALFRTVAAKYGVVINPPKSGGAVDEDPSATADTQTVDGQPSSETGETEATDADSCKCSEPRSIVHGQYGDHYNRVRQTVTRISIDAGSLPAMPSGGSRCLYSVPNNDLAPLFLAGTTVIIDRSVYDADRELKSCEIPSPGWFLISLYNMPVIRRLVPAGDQIKVRGVPGEEITVPAVRVMGVVIAKVAIEPV